MTLINPVTQYPSDPDEEKQSGTGLDADLDVHGRPRRGLLRRQRQARRPSCADHRSRLRHRPGGGDRLRARGSGRGHELPSRGAGGRRRRRWPRSATPVARSSSCPRTSPTSRRRARSSPTRSSSSAAWTSSSLVAGKQQAVEDIVDITSEQFDQTYKTNVYAMFWMIQEAVPHLPAGSSIITTSSVQAYSPSPHLVDYASTKAAINTFSKALAQQLAPKGIRVNVVAPGSGLDPAAGLRRPADRGARQLRRGHPARPHGPADRDGAGVRVPRLARVELRRSARPST